MISGTGRFKIFAMAEFHGGEVFAEHLERLYVVPEGVIRVGRPHPCDLEHVGSRVHGLCFLCFNRQR